MLRRTHTIAAKVNGCSSVHSGGPQETGSPRDGRAVSDSASSRSLAQGQDVTWECCAQKRKNGLSFGDNWSTFFSAVASSRVAGQQVDSHEKKMSSAKSRRSLPALSSRNVKTELGLVHDLDLYYIRQIANHLKVVVVSFSLLMFSCGHKIP